MRLLESGSETVGTAWRTSAGWPDDEVGPARPVDRGSAPAAGTAAEFISALRAWKIRAGNPSFQELQRRTGVPRSTLADALNPQRRGLPRWEVVAALVQTLAATPEESARWRHAWTVLQLEADDRAAATGSRSGAGTVPAARTGRILPRQLPPAISHFTGRTEQFDHLAELFARAVHGGGPRGAAVAAVITGPPGVGKTALAVQWAHAVADRFPDGQLYLDLRGSRPSGPGRGRGLGLGPGPGFEPGPERGPLTGVAAVRILLAGLLPHGKRIPADPTALLALYRSRLAGTRTLLVLDDAADADQVRPLLPGSSDCLVIVTSRSPLTDLVAVDGAEPVPLGPLTGREAQELVTRRLGSARGTLDRRTAAALADLCSRSPLALNRLAARALLFRDLTLRELLTELAADPTG